jgi:hypothetical protein
MGHVKADRDCGIVGKALFPMPPDISRIIEDDKPQAAAPRRRR